MNENMNNTGLQPLPFDERDFTVGALFELPKPVDLPSEFILEGWKVKDQGNSDFCSAFASTAVSELQEGVELSPEWSFAMGKKISGNVDAWGANLRDAMAPHVKYGDIPKTIAPFSVATEGNIFLRRAENWPEDLIPKATPYQKQAYMRVVDKYDAFDNIRATIYKFRDEKRAVVIGVNFSWDWKQEILDTVGAGYGHAMYCVGWKTIAGVPYLIIVNSGGSVVGKDGTHLMARSVINYYEPIYGAYMFVDKTREDIQYMIDNKIKEGDGWLSQMLKIMLTLIISPFLTKTEKVQIIKETTNTLNDISEKLVPKTPDPEPIPATVIVSKGTRLSDMCEAIKYREGWFAPCKQYPNGTPAWRNKNPGNLKYAGQFGSIGKDARGFAIFPTETAGRSALERQILLVAKNMSKVYPKDCTIAQFFNVYAPGHDNNDPVDYARQVATKMGVRVDWKLSNLI